MKSLHLITLMALGLGAANLSAVPKYQPVADWLHLPDGLDKMGNAHGDVAVSDNGDVYVSITTGPKAGVQVYNSEGRYLRNLEGAPKDFHGFVIRKIDGQEHLYGTSLGGQTIHKLTLAGEEVLKIDVAALVPAEFMAKPRNAKAKPRLRLTAIDVAPDGDLFAVDGYGNDYVHRFDPTGRYLKSFGGRGKAPYNFKTLHKIAIDTRFNPARIIGVDRENMRVVHLSLDGEMLGVVNNEMLRPAAVVVRGDYAVVGEIKGRVAFLDKEGKVVSKLGYNEIPEDAMNNKTPPNRWRLGVFTAPHGVAFNRQGDLFVTEYSIYGRIHRFNHER
jgi:hypothetical protein